MNNRIKISGSILLTLALVIGTLFAVFPLGVTAADPVSIWDGAATDAFGGGDGSAATPYLINNAKELAYLAIAVNNGEAFAEKYFALKTDIDLDGKPWTPIGVYAETVGVFSGIFDGEGHTVSGFNCDVATEYSGLFGRMSCGQILNLNVKGTLSKSGNYAGTIAGYALGPSAKIINCTSDVELVTSRQAGGIAGRASKSDQNEIVACISYSNVVASLPAGLEKTDIFAGGIVGAGGGLKIEYCANYGSVKSEYCTKYSVAGGIIAMHGADSMYAMVYNCFNAGDISATQGATNYYAGGIIARANHVTGGELVNCLNVGTATIIANPNAPDEPIVSEAHVGGINGINKAPFFKFENNYSVFEPLVGDDNLGVNTETSCYALTEAKVKAATVIADLKFEAEFWSVTAGDYPMINTAAVINARNKQQTEVTTAVITTAQTPTTTKPVTVTTATAISTTAAPSGETTKAEVASTTASEGAEKEGCGSKKSGTIFAIAQLLMTVGAGIVFIIIKKKA